MEEHEDRLPIKRKPLNKEKKPLFKSDALLQPSFVEDRSYVYLATHKPETTVLSGQWEMAVNYLQLDKVWKQIVDMYPERLSNVTVVKCPTLHRFYQQHKGHHENFYKEVSQASELLSFYVQDCTDITRMKNSFKDLRDAFPRAKLSFTVHEKQATGRDSNFVYANEKGYLKFSEPLYLSFCKRNKVAAKKLNKAEKISFTSKFAGKYEFTSLPERFVVLDTETTGMDYVQGNVTEIGAVIVEKSTMQIVATFEQLIKIEGKLSWYITKLTGITDKLLAEQGKPAAQTLARLRTFVADLPIIAHNARFDKGFVDMEFMKNRMPMLKNRWIDSIDIFNNHLLNRPSYALSALVNELAEDFVQKHRALADVLAVVELLKEVARLTKEKEGLFKPS